MNLAEVTQLRPTSDSATRRDCEVLAVAFVSEAAALRAVLPQPLVAQSNAALLVFEASRVAGHGTEVELSVQIPALLHGEAVQFIACRIGESDSFAHGRLLSLPDVVSGVLDIAGETAAAMMLERPRGPGGARVQSPAPSPAAIERRLGSKRVELFRITDRDGRAAVAQLLAHDLSLLHIHAAIETPAALDLSPRLLARLPGGRLPVERVICGLHLRAAMQTGVTRIVHDYRRPPRAAWH
jgi:acetoacetate decarboxylase